MELIIESRLHGPQRFTCSDAGGYIYWENDGLEARQICDGGKTLGNTLTAKEPTQFERKCRAWWKAYLNNNKY